MLKNDKDNAAYFVTVNNNLSSWLQLDNSIPSSIIHRFNKYLPSTLMQQNKTKYTIIVSRGLTSRVLYGERLEEGKPLFRNRLKRKRTMSFYVIFHIHHANLGLKRSTCCLCYFQVLQFRYHGWHDSYDSHGVSGCGPRQGLLTVVPVLNTQ